MTVELTINPVLPGNRLTAPPVLSSSRLPEALPAIVLLISLRSPAILIALLGFSSARVPFPVNVLSTMVSEPTRSMPIPS